MNEIEEKKPYVTPKVKVVPFLVERGFSGSDESIQVRTTDQITQQQAFDMLFYQQQYANGQNNGSFTGAQFGGTDMGNGSWFGGESNGYF